MNKHNSRKKLHVARQGVLYSLILCTVILLFGGIGFWALDPHVKTLSDGLWLAFTTAATVGYGDLVPSTHASRIFSVFVVLMGLAVLSLATASLAAVLVETDVQAGEQQIENDLMQELKILRSEVQALRVEIATLRPDSVQSAPSFDANQSKIN